jgi:hypothetical protein
MGTPACNTRIDANGNFYRKDKVKAPKRGLLYSCLFALLRAGWQHLFLSASIRVAEIVCKEK